MATPLDLQEQEQLDQIKAFWNQYGNLITWTLTLALAGFAGWNGWNWWQRSQATKAGALYDAGAPAAALAQVPAEIQVYGRANVSYERITVDGAGTSETNWEVVDNSSRIGIRGKRDLGGGMSGFFQVESRVKLDDGAGSTFSSRDSYIGMQGGFGTVRLGRTIGPVYYATYDYISNHNHDTGTSSDATGGFAELVLGSFGHHLVHHAARPVVVVPDDAR